MDLIPSMSQLAANALANGLGLDIGPVAGDVIELLATGTYSGVRAGVSYMFNEHVENTNQAHNSIVQEPSMHSHKRHCSTHAEPSAHAEGTEPEGHGNAPATGTHIGGFVEKYVPVNFPDKFTVKERYCDSWVMRSTANAASNPSRAYIIWNTNNCFLPLNASLFAKQNLTHRPNQRANWAAQFGYYRVVDFTYKITVTNISAGTGFIETASPPGTFVNPVYVNDCIMTLQKVQIATDVNSSTVEQESQWEQKTSHNEYLQSRSPGSLKTIHVFTGDVKSEDFDMDPVTTAADETWTAVGISPNTTKLLGLSCNIVSPYNTAALLAEVGVQVFAEFTYTVQYAGYLPGLRQVTS